MGEEPSAVSLIGIPEWSSEQACGSPEVKVLPPPTLFSARETHFDLPPSQTPKLTSPTEHGWPLGQSVKRIGHTLASKGPHDPLGPTLPF